MPVRMRNWDTGMTVFKIVNKPCSSLNVFIPSYLKTAPKIMEEGVPLLSFFYGMFEILSAKIKISE